MGTGFISCLGQPFKLWWFVSEVEDKLPAAKAIASLNFYLLLVVWLALLWIDLWNTSLITPIISSSITAWIGTGGNLNKCHNYKNKNA